MTKTEGLIILGLNSAYHESAAALVRGGEPILAVEEERFTRVKRAKPARVCNPDQLPWNSINACLDAAGGLRLADVDAIGYSLVPDGRLAMIGIDPYPVPATVGFGTEEGEHEFNCRVRGVPRLLAEAAGCPQLVQRVHFIPHHLAHASSVFHTSPFTTAAVLVVDGIGERSTAWLGKGTPSGLEAIEEIPYPHSLGMLWERVAVYLGFTECDACKVMGLAAYGDARRFAPEMDQLLALPFPDGGDPRSREPPFVVDASLARFRSDDVLGLESLFGAPPRR